VLSEALSVPGKKRE